MARLPEAGFSAKAPASNDPEGSMAVEIERKFIARPDVLAHCRSGTPLVQG